MSARLTSVSIIHERALETCEPSYVVRAVWPFFIPVVSSLLRAVGCVTAPELSSRGDRARIHETRDSTGAYLGKEVRSEDEKYVAASELNSVKRRDPVPRNI
jgi:hypothetical protein